MDRSGDVTTLLHELRSGSKPKLELAITRITACTSITAKPHRQVFSGTQ